MSEPRWRRAEVAELVVFDEGWHDQDDQISLQKLGASLRRHGQLRPVIVRQRPGNGSEPVVVDGRAIVRVMRTLGWQQCDVLDVGMLDDDAARVLRLDLLLCLAMDFSALGEDVAKLIDAGHHVDALAAASPFDATRIAYFGKLARWDWKQYEEQHEGQTIMNWDAELQHVDVPAVAVTPPVAPAELALPVASWPVPEPVQAASLPVASPTGQPAPASQPAAVAASEPQRGSQTPAPASQPKTKPKSRKAKPEAMQGSLW